MNFLKSITSLFNRAPRAEAEPGRETDAGPFTSQSVRTAKQSRFSPIHYATPKRVGQILAERQAGELCDFALLTEDILERDDKCAAAAPKRTMAVSRNGWEIVIPKDNQAEGSGKKAGAKRHAKILEGFYNHLTVTHAIKQNQQGGLALLIRQMMMARVYEYSVHSIAWPVVDGELRAELWHVPLNFFEARGPRLGFLETQGLHHGTPMPESDWMVTVSDFAIGPALLVCWILKRLPMQDWLTYCEKFGIPGLLGKTAAAAGTREHDAMVEAVANYLNDWGAVVSGSDTIELVAAGGGTSLPFQPLIDELNRSMVTLLLGSDLATMSRKDGTGASLQQNQTNTIEQDDALWIEEALNTSLTRQVIEWYDGPGAEPLAYIHIKTTPQDETDKEIKVDNFLIRHVPMSAADLYERYGRQAPKAGEETVGGQAARAELLGKTNGAGGSFNRRGAEAQSKEKGLEPEKEKEPAANEGDNPLLNHPAVRVVDVDMHAVRLEAVGELLAEANLPEAYLAPLQAEYLALIDAAADAGVSDERLQELAGETLKLLPELRLNTRLLAETLRIGMEQAHVQGLIDRISKLQTGSSHAEDAEDAEPEGM